MVEYQTLTMNGPFTMVVSTLASSTKASRSVNFPTMTTY